VLWSTLVAAIVTASFAAPAAAQGHDDHGGKPVARSHGPTPQESAFAKLVRSVTEKYRHVSVATADGYNLMFGCVSGGEYGAMGLHYVNLPLVTDGELDPRKPEIILYEALPNGRRRITGVDYLVFAADWDAKNQGPPILMGQLLHRFEAPNRYGLPAFYTLHVWAWKENPNGAFTNWNPNVSCDAFDAEGGIQ
jgi:hypothetical protein